MKNCLLMFACCLISFSANAETLSKQEMGRFVQDTFNDQSISVMAGQIYDLPKEKAKILTESLKRYAKEPLYIEFLVDQIIQLGLDSKKWTKNDKQMQIQLYLISRSFQEYLYKKGLSKASERDLITFFEYQIKTSKALSPAACSAFNMGVPKQDLPSDLVKATSRIYKDLSVAELKRYQEHLFNVRMLALDNFLPPTELSSVEKELAVTAYQRSLIKEMEKSRNPQRLSKTFQNMESSSEKDVCDASIVMFKAVMNGSGRARELKMRWFVSQYM